MDVVAQIAELIGFDILFLGGITLVACSFAIAFWHHPHFGSVPFVSCVDYLRRLFTGGSVFLYGTLVFSAALFGMVVNLSADRLLDDEDIVRRIPNFIGETLLPEDELKLEAIKAATNLMTNPRIAAILRNHSHALENEKARATAEGANGAKLENRLDPARSLMQHA